jgi:hypothetical protein
MNQKQRESLIDLLLLGMFADGSLKVSDDRQLLSVIEEIGWESYQTPDLYFQSAIAKARDAADTEARTLARLKKINDGLASDDIRQQALDRLQQFLSLDGEPGQVVLAKFALDQQRLPPTLHAGDRLKTVTRGVTEISGSHLFEESKFLELAKANLHGKQVV